MNNSIIVLLAVIAILMSTRNRNGTPISRGRFLAIFAAILTMHVVVICGLVLYGHWMHS